MPCLRESRLRKTGECKENIFRFRTEEKSQAIRCQHLTSQKGKQGRKGKAHPQSHGLLIFIVFITSILSHNTWAWGGPGSRRAGSTPTRLLRPGRCRGTPHPRVPLQLAFLTNALVFIFPTRPAWLLREESEHLESSLGPELPCPGTEWAFLEEVAAGEQGPAWQGPRGRCVTAVPIPQEAPENPSSWMQRLIPTAPAGSGASCSSPASREPLGVPEHWGSRWPQAEPSEQLQEKGRSCRYAHAQQLRPEQRQIPAMRVTVPLTPSPGWASQAHVTSEDLHSCLLR